MLALGSCGALAARLAAIGRWCRFTARQLAERMRLLQATQHGERNAARGDEALHDIELVKHERTFFRPGAVLLE